MSLKSKSRQAETCRQPIMVSEALAGRWLDFHLKPLPLSRLAPSILHRNLNCTLIVCKHMSSCPGSEQAADALMHAADRAAAHLQGSMQRLSTNGCKAPPLASTPSTVDDSLQPGLTNASRSSASALHLRPALEPPTQAEAGRPPLPSNPGGFLCLI